MRVEQSIYPQIVSYLPILLVILWMLSMITSPKPLAKNQVKVRMKLKYLSVLLQDRLISAKLELVLSHTEKLCIALYYIQFSTNI